MPTIRFVTADGERAEDVRTAAGLDAGSADEVTSRQVDSAVVDSAGAATVTWTQLRAGTRRRDEHGRR